MLKVGHDKLDHNGNTQTYMLFEVLYYWKGLKVSINRYIEQSKTCKMRNVQVVKYVPLHFSTPWLPMPFISMNLAGPFNPSS